MHMKLELQIFRNRIADSKCKGRTTLHTIQESLGKTLGVDPTGCIRTSTNSQLVIGIHLQTGQEYIIKYNMYSIIYNIYNIIYNKYNMTYK